MSVQKSNCYFNYVLLVIGLLVMFAILLIPLEEGYFVRIAKTTTEKPQRRDQQHHDMRHYKQSKHLDDYMDTMQLLLEPSTSYQRVKRIIIMVTSRPSDVERREAIRRTWGKILPTYFLLGVEEYIVEGDQLPKYIKEEAKKYDDIVVYNLWEHYQNLTIKSMLMIKWTLDRCPKVDIYFKTDDDVLVNPWVLEKVIHDHNDSQLIGFRRSVMVLSRSQNDRYFVPRWMQPVTTIKEYLRGSGYIIYGKYLSRIYEKARAVPLMNLEDVYVTYYVAKRGLGLNLTHDWRMIPYSSMRIYLLRSWERALSHYYTPHTMYAVWKLLLRFTLL